MSKGYTTIPNGLDDSSLDVYQFRILIRIKRRGICYESQRSMSESLGISLAQVNRTVKWLRANGWIEPTVDPKSSKIGYQAVIPEERLQQNPVIPGEHVIPEVEHVIPGERHLKKNPKEENNIQGGVVADDIALQPLITAVSQICKEPFWDKTRKDYDDLALLLFGWEATPETVASFGEVWQHHGYYPGKPALSTIATEYRSWLAGTFPNEKPSPNGNGRIDDAAIWDTVLQHARKADANFTDPMLKAAVRRFGWRKLQDIKPGNENFYRKDFLRIYHEQSTTATA